MRILVVDKLASFRRRIRSWLTESGHSDENIFDAPSGPAALEFLRREDFNIDAIVCEWEQETVRALELLSQIRAVPGFAHIAFIAIGPPDPESEKMATMSRASTYLHQPLDPDQLLRTLVDLEKAAIAARKKVPSPTTRWRLLTLDQKPSEPQPLGSTLTGVAESELRQGARSLFLDKGSSLSLQPGDPLYWVEKGAVQVREVRADGTVLEYPLGASQFLGEAPYGGCPILSIHAKAEGEAWLASRDAGSVERLRARHPVLFYSFRNIATERLRRFVKTESRKPVERGLAGEIESLPVGDLIQILHGAKKTGVLKIETPEQTWFVQFTGGSIRHAEAEGNIGEEVFQEALMLDKGKFEFMVGPAVEGPVTIATDTPTLLLEGLKKREQRKSRPPKVRETP